MQERMGGGGREMKHILYTVVGEDRKPGLLVWSIRIILFLLLLVVLAVVPYVSLRLAQSGDHTLVVFQPIPVRNHSHGHRHFKLFSPAPPKKHLNHSSVPNVFQSAEIALEKQKLSMQSVNESAVLPPHVSTTLSSELFNMTNNVSTETFLNKSIDENVTMSSVDYNNDVYNESGTTFKPFNLTKELEENLETTSSVSLKSSEVYNVTTSRDVDLIVQNTTETGLNPILQHPHKIVYVGTAVSGDHIGGFCVWKENKDIKKWEYFYENVPVEYQSSDQNSDKEMRALLVAVRLWELEWYDYHVVFRLQHSITNNPKNALAVRTIKEIEKISGNNFTYEFEWRLKNQDSVVDIAVSLAKLHKDFAHWYGDFKAKVEQLLGSQDWSSVKQANEKAVNKLLFSTGETFDVASIKKAHLPLLPF